SFDGYMDTLLQCVRSLRRAGFTKFFFLNGHGGNTGPNGIVTRILKEEEPDTIVGHSGYFDYIPDAVLQEVMEGPLKQIRHACEAEASMVMHLHPDLVRKERLRDDGLQTEPSVRGLTLLFDELTEQGSYGYGTLATSEKGKRLFEAAVAGATKEIGAIADGFVLKGI
ncbi:MAG TPA: creatininase family protein, partial [Fimbriimonadaceae bacterium]|nr:creatininase family protein [Fimbriimonadaceae bacterium]